MKKLFILFGIVLSCSVMGQGTNVVMHSTYVKPAPTGGGGSNMLTDGTLDSGATYWNFGTSWAFNTDHAEYDNLANGALGQADGDMQTSIELSTDYTLTFDLTVVSGTPRFGIYNYALNKAYVSIRSSWSAGNNSIGFTTNSEDISGGGLSVYAIAGEGEFEIDNLVLTAD